MNDGGHRGGIEADGVRAGYREREVLQGVSLAVAPGELLSVLGPNGSGKSTLIRVLSGTLAVSAGSVKLMGVPLARLSRKQIAARVAVVPQDSQVVFAFSVEQVVMMGRAPHQGAFLRPAARDREAVERALEACELGPIRERSVFELSGGERRRVLIARALAQEPAVLLLDEPAAHLDIRHAVALYELSRSEVRERQVACVAVMHDLNAAARWADRALLLDQGRVAACGPVAEVLVPELLTPVFGVPIRVGRDPSDGVPYFVPQAPEKAAS